MHIRYAKISDISRLLRLYDQLKKTDHRPIGVKTLKLMLKAPSKKILIAEDAFTSFLGLLEFTVSRKYSTRISPLIVYFDYVVIDANYRKQGIGRALFKYVTDEYKSKGCNEFYSEVTIENTGSQIFHKKLGFKAIETVIRYRLDSLE